LTQSLKKYLVILLNSLTVKIVTLGFRQKSKVEMTRLGTEYGGWWVPLDALTNGNLARALVSAGLGQDVSFDKEMLTNGFDLFGLDPLSSSISFATQELNDFPNKHILKLGLWLESGEIDFFAPKNAMHDSWSITNSQASDKELSKSFPAISISQLFIDFPQLQEYDYLMLKMDIEGAEVPILVDLDFSNFHFDFLAIEIDYISMIPFKNFRERLQKIFVVRRVLHKIRNSGYKLILTENFNFFWLLKK